MSLPHRSVLALAIAVLVSGSVLAADYARIPRDQVQSAVARGASVVHDYGSFAWVRGSGSGAGEAETFSLDLGWRSFDPRQDSAANIREYGDGKALRLIQFDGPVKQEWLDSLAATGVRPLQYIAPFSYVVWADSAALAQARQRGSALRWTGDFLAKYKTANVNEGLLRGEQQWRAMLYRGAGIADAALRASGVSVGKRSAIDREFEIVELDGANAQALQQLAQMPGVYALDPVPRDGGKRAELANQITANNLSASNLPVPGYLAWLATAGVTGNGVRIANVDGGIFDTHPDLAGRMLPCAGDTCGGPATDDHGTHTAGIMAGDGSSGSNDANGFRRGLGMAPGARLIEQVYDPTFTQAGGMLKLMRQSQDNGADLSGNSWGPAGSPRGYDADTRQVDVGTRDTKPDIAGDQPLTYVLSVMNGYGGTSSQGSPDEAKNVITVGSTKAQTIAGAAIPQFNDLSDNSGHGPALDGRRIPHMVAPGCSVDSPVSATGYGFKCGTSMASPQVSGLSALFIEKYRVAHAGASPSAALIKAALIAATMDLNGHFDADGVALGHRPDSRQGWGRVRADWLISPAVPVLYYDQDTRVFDNTGESWTLNIAPADPARPVQIVLAYTDAPGHGLGGATPAWNNDLDLSVGAGSSIYLGNVFGADGNSATGGSADSRNNVESVVLTPAALAGGAVDVRVAATNISSDALPNRGDATDQDFALVCVNCVSQPDYTLSFPDTSRAVCTASASTASYAVAIGSVMSYATPVNLSLAGLPAGATGVVTPPSVIPGSGASVDLSTLGAVAPGNYSFQLQATSTSANRSHDLGLAVANAVPAAPALLAPAAGAANVALRPTFSWAAAAQGRDYVLEVASDAAFGSILFSATTQLTSSTTDIDLPSNVQLYWRVRSDNVCGTGTSAAGRPFTTVAVPGDCGLGSAARTLLSENVENGANGWVASAGSGSTTWMISTARPYGGSGSSWLAQDMDSSSDQRLTSPTVALPSGENPLTLQFQNDQTMEPRGSTGCWDGGFIEVSSDGGATFAALPGTAMLTDPFDGPLQAGPAINNPAWCGDPQPYMRSVVDLSAYAGQSVKIRFRMTSDTTQGRLPHGWYVDNIRVQSCAVQPPDSIFGSGFELTP